MLISLFSALTGRWNADSTDSFSGFLVTLANSEFHRNFVAVSTYLRVMNINQKICVSPYHSRSSTQAHR